MNVIKHFIIIVCIICSDKLNEPNIYNLPINISTANTRITAVNALILVGNNCIQNKYTFYNTSECLDKVIFRRRSIFLNSICGNDEKIAAAAEFLKFCTTLFFKLFIMILHTFLHL